MSEKLKALHALGQSMWYDNIARDLLQSGAIKQLVEAGVMGLTSNPAIFQKAITSGTAYDAEIADLVHRTLDPKSMYETLAVHDIQAAADILKPVYEQTKGVDGYVSLEVSPLLANDTQGTADEAARLWQWVKRPNLMIKVPATEAGLPAVTTSIAQGINVNVTLIFGLDMYAKVMEAYIAGLEQRAANGLPLNNIASVASFFVSRVDTLVDKLLGEQDALKGKAAIGNAKLAYQLFKQTFSGPRWEALAAKGAQLQRPLWASTSTKDPSYPDTIYVDTLIGPHTVNTAPPATIDAFIDHGVLALTVEDGLEEVRRDMEALAAAGIDLKAVTDQLLEEGVAKFSGPFEDLLSAIEQKSAQLAGAR